MEKVKVFFEKLATDPKAQELLKDCPKPKDPEEALKMYVGFAGKLGTDLSEEELKAFLMEKEKAVEDRTETAAAQIRELEDVELEQVAGGKYHDNCRDTFRDHENCWVNDGCDIAYHQYTNYGCYWNTKSSCQDGDYTFVA